MIFTPDQTRAVACNDPLIVVTAGAGAGKTAVLTRRVARLLHGEVYPSSVLVATFTRAAATELRERLAEMLGEKTIEGLQVKTIHAWCLSLLREHPEQVGLSPDFTVYDQDDVNDIQTQILSDLCIKQKTWKGATSKGHPDQAWGLVEEYRRRLLSWDATDFDGLLRGAEKTLQWMTSQDSYRPLFGHVLVDEAQDTAPMPWRIFDLLGARSLFIVGDPRQSIYSFQGARLDELQDMERRGNSIVLRENFRSLQNIVEVANRYSEKMVPRQPSMTPKREASDPGHPVVYRHTTAEAIANQVAAALDLDKDLRPQDVAILARTWAALEPISEALAAAGVPANLAAARADPWRLAGVRVVLSALRSVCNRRDEHSARVVLSETARDVAKLRAIARRGGVPLLLADDDVARVVMDAAEVVDDALKAAALLAERLRLAATYATTGRDTKCVQVLLALTLIRDWQAQGRGASVGELLDWLTQRDLQERAKEAAADGVYLGTVHSAKGLEWSRVWAIDWHPRGDGEEELRCWYVAITRARDGLVMASLSEGETYYTAI